MKKFLLPFLIILVVLIAAEGCKKKTACDSIACLNGGSCNAGVCTCDTLHEGTYCEIDKRTRYVGSAVGSEDCTSRNHLDYLRITAVLDTANQLNFHNLYGDESNIKGIIQNDGSVYIPDQTWGGRNISGIAMVSNGKVVVNFTVINGGNTEVCSWTEKW